MKVNTMKRNWDISPEDVKPLIIGGFLCLISLCMSQYLGGIEKPFGAVSLIFPLFVLTNVIIPTMREEIQSSRYFEVFKKHLKLWNFQIACFIQKYRNQRLLKSLRKLRRTVFLGWLYS